MTIVTDPDNLDRFKLIVDPEGGIISARGLGAARQAVQTNGQTDGTTTFTRAAGNFTTDSVAVGDVLCILDDPASDGGIIGHYRVTSGVGTTTLVVDRSIPNHTGSDLTWRIFQAGTVGNSVPDVSDGVTGQAVYSFFNEEWITLDSGLGNAADLNAFLFPLTPLTRESYILGGTIGSRSKKWAFAENNGVLASESEGQTRELIRTAGWIEVDENDITLREYAGVVTLGTQTSAQQTYYQQGDANGAPTNFKLTGAVNQAVLTFGPDVGPDAVGAGFAITATTVTRNDGGNWATDNYRVGDYVTIRGAEDAGNNGNWGPITAVDNSTDGAITIASGGLTVNADDTTAIFQVDHRRYLELRLRPKAFSYEQSGIGDIGVTLLEGIVNRFPLSASADPAILLQDGVMAGDGTATGQIFQESESLLTAADGATESTPTAATDAFTFTSATGGFTATVARTIAILRAGDAFVISSGSDAGSYVIKSVDSDTVVSLYKDPLLTYTGGEGTLSYDARTPLIDVGSGNASTATNGELTDAGATFGVDTAIGDRIVTAGDIVEIYSGDAGTLGYYKVTSQDSATVLTLEATSTDDQPFTVQTNQSYRIWRSGMFLQRFETTQGDIANDPSFNDANPDTITRAAGSWITDGYDVGGAVFTSSATVSANDSANGRVIATSVALTLTLIAEETLTTDATDTSAILSYETGIVRTINSVAYPFHWRLFANAGKLNQIYQFLQWKLRLTSDIDGATAVARGDITDLLMTFASPNGVTLDLFPDDLDAGESNNVTYTDLTGDARNNAFLVGITFVFNANLIGSAANRATVFFDDPDGTPASGDEFGTIGAVIVDDETATDMNFTGIAGNVQRSFDYTNNNQGSRTPDTDADCTIQVGGDSLAQFTTVQFTITKVNALTVNVTNALERTYST
jgi:hypothetical protein